MRLQQLSSLELVTSYLQQIKENRHLNVFITELAENAKDSAIASDERIKQGSALPLDGIPIAVKDNFCTKGILTTAGSKMLEQFVPTYESTVTQKLIDAGAILIGKTNMDEFAMGSSTESSYFGATINPVGVRLGLENLSPGGSSGGSAAAVAANLAAGAVGTDTGGSIRQPASFCGVVGFKPTYGICSRYGIVAYASSLDQAGVFAKSVKDTAIMMDVISGSDEKDTTSIPNLSLNFEKALEIELPKIKIGLIKEVVEAGNTSDTDIVWQKITELSEQLNFEIEEVSVPTFNYSLAAYYISALSEASSNLARYDGVRYGHRAELFQNVDDMYMKTRQEGFGPEVQRRILTGTFSLSSGYYDAYYLKAQKVRNKIKSEFDNLFGKVDCIMMPTTPSTAFELGSLISNPVEMYLEDVYTVAVNLAGLPAISLPVASSTSGMPLGLQIIGKQFSDEKLLRIASSVELAEAIISDR
jgi:aspartyl-tRNA(Asn)/glutamyl-tRNA(Gln) amidotransferase subunit A